MITKNRIFTINDHIENDELLELMADSLISDGIVKPSFKYAVIEREKHFPTGIDTGMHSIAIPHSEYEHIIETGFAFAVLPNKSVSFASADDDCCMLTPTVVIMMAIAPITEKVEIIQNIFGVLGDFDVITSIVGSDNDGIVKLLEPIFNV